MASLVGGVTFRALGPLEVLIDGTPAPPGSPQLRLVLAALLIHANEVVSADRLVDILWADAPPSSALATLQKLVYRLRMLLASDRVERDGPIVATRAPGYVLQVDDGAYDAAHFSTLIGSAGGAARAGDRPQALLQFDEALDLWRGSAFEEFAFAEFAQAEAARLDELRLVATEDRAEVKLALGDHDELIGELRVLVSANPYRERLWAQLMLSLYRAGRQAEALREYTRVRELLAENLGIGTGAALRDLEQAILVQDPALDAPDLAGGAPVALNVAPIEAPSGTVTFLFTDVEGSTGLWEEHPVEMQSALARHDAIVRDAIAANDGYLVKTTGDGAHAAFARADDAIRAARDAQLALTAEQWPEFASLRVRMGVNTGAAELRGGDYYGPAVNRAARLMSAAHGAQIVVSLATEELVRDNLDDGVALIDLGEHQLRDLARPERTFQLTAPGLAHGFAPLQSVAALRGNLPEQYTSFVGRERDLVGVVDALGEARLVTITGVGGVGKTRLALQTAAQLLPDYPDGTWLVELAPATDQDAVEQIVATTLGAQQHSGLSLGDAVREFLRSKHLLLVLDNCEHLLDETGGLVDAILVACPRVRILATSREGIGLAGERILALRSLAVPELSATPDMVTATDATRLFTERARAARADFFVDETNAGAVAEICRRLDGIPLALELAAARVVALRPVEIASLLDERFRLLAGGRRTGVERHQTLRATVDWSYSWLTESERLVFKRVGVFSGTFDSSAVLIVVTGDDLDEWAARDALSSLVAKSMLVDEAGLDGTTRYRQLETLRSYALERLGEDDDVDWWRRRHAEYYAEFSEMARPGVTGPDEFAWLVRVDAEIDNLRAALTWAVGRDDPADVELAIRIVAAYAHTGRGLKEFGVWSDRLVDRLASSTPGRRAEVLAAAASWNAMMRADPVRGRALALEAARDRGPDEFAGVSTAYVTLCYAAAMEGDVAAALEWVAEGDRVFGGNGDPLARSGLFCAGAAFGGSFGRYELAREYAERSLTEARRAGQPSGIAGALFATGVALEVTDPPVSLAAYEEAVAIYRAGPELGIGQLGMSLGGVARHRIGSDDVGGALTALRDAIAHCHYFGEAPQLVGFVNEAVVALAHTGHSEQAAVFAGLVASGGFASQKMMWNPERLDAVIVELRDELGSARYDAAAATGAAIPADEAVHYVLAELDRLRAELSDP